MLKSDDKLKIEKYIIKLMDELAKDAKDSIASGKNDKEVIDRITKVTVNKVTPESKMIMTSIYKMLSRDTLSEELFQNTENKAAFYEIDILSDLNNRFIFDVPDKIDYSESKNELDKLIESGSVAVVVVGGAVSIIFKSFVPFEISLAVAIAAIMGLIIYNKNQSNNKISINSLISEYLRSVQTALMSWVETIESYYDERIAELMKGMNA